MKEPMTRPGITLYTDVLEPIIDTCSPEEIGTLLIALFKYERGEVDPAIAFNDKVLQLAFNSLKASSARDEEAYRKKRCTNAVIALYRKWKTLRKASGQSADMDTFEGECLDEISEIRTRCNYYGELNFNK